MRTGLATILFGVVCLIGSQALFAKECDCEGEVGQQWTNFRDGKLRTGGCVGSQAKVAIEALIAPSAKVCGTAEVKGDTRIFGQCVVSGDSSVEGASCYGNARIDGKAILTGRYVRVFGNAHVTGSTTLSGVTKVNGELTLSRGAYDNKEVTPELISSSQLLAGN